MGINISRDAKPHTINREIAVCSGTTQLLKSETVIQYRKKVAVQNSERKQRFNGIEIATVGSASQGQ